MSTHNFLKSSIIAAAAILACTSCGTKTDKEMQHESDPFLFSDQIEWQDAGGGAERQILGYNDDIMMVRINFDKGDGGATHSHPHSQVTFIASGVFEFTLGEETKTVKAGDGLYIEPNIPHGCTCIESGTVVDCFSPMRETFIGAEEK